MDNLENNYPYVFAALNNALHEVHRDVAYYRDRCDALTNQLANARAELERMDKLLKNAVNPGEERNDATVSLY